jgi:hypothetical protein
MRRERYDYIHGKIEKTKDIKTSYKTQNSQMKRDTSTDEKKKSNFQIWKTNLKMRDKRR